MTHPGADMGLEWPSLLNWRKTNRSVDHVVLGKGHPGGAWQVRTFCTIVAQHLKKLLPVFLSVIILHVITRP